MRKILLFAGVLFAASTLTVPLAPAQAGGASMTAPTAVSGETPLPRPWEPNRCGTTTTEFQDWEQDNRIAVNPANSANLVAAWQQDALDAIVVGYSTDAGRRWTSVVPRTTACTWQIAGADPSKQPLDFSQFITAVDPWLAFGPSRASTSQPIVYLTSVVIGGFASAAIVNRSVDGGRTWSDPEVLAAHSIDSDGTTVDMSNVVADPARPGHAYAAWNEISGPILATTVRVSRTEDGGENWSTPVQIPSRQPGHLRTVGQLMVLPDLDGKQQLVNVFSEVPPQPVKFLGVVLGQQQTPVTGPTTLFVTRSTDQGRTWSTPEQIAVADQERGTSAAATLAPDGRTIYVAWPEDQSDVTGSRFDLMYSKSTNGGFTWQEPKKVGDTIPGPQADETGGALAVAPDGTVGVMFYDHRNDNPDNPEQPQNNPPRVTDLWLRHSHDGGRTWREGQLAGHFDRTTAPNRNIGNYQGLAPMPGGLGATFVLARPLAVHGDTDVFFTRLRL